MELKNIKEKAKNVVRFMTSPQIKTALQLAVAVIAVVNAVNRFRDARRNNELE